MTRSLTLALAAALAMSAAATAQQAPKQEKAPAKAKAVKLKAPKTAAEKIANAMSAAPAAIAEHATIMDWPTSREGKPVVIREGHNGWVCFPTPPNVPGNVPMCNDDAWMKWGEAYDAKKDPPPATFGLSYMIAPGGGSGSNTDPFAEKETPDNEWGHDGPHLMMLLPAEAMKGLPTKRTNAGAYVMWAGTPYAHVMIPVK